MKDFISTTFSPQSLLNFFAKDRSVLGIDVGTSSLKIIQIRREKEQAVLETYGELSAAAYSGGEPGRAVLLADEKVSEMIVDLKKEAGATAKRAVIGIPVRYSFITVVEMPELTDERRKILAKSLSAKLEESKISLRQERDKIWKDIQEKEKDGEISEDDKFRFKDEMQKIVDGISDKLEETAKTKEKEIIG